MTRLCLSYLLSGFCGAALLFAIPGRADEALTAPQTTKAWPEAPITVPEAAVPRKPLPLPDFNIESSRTLRIEVAEPPPMAGLPAVEGAINLNIHSVADPGLPEPPPKVGFDPSPTYPEIYTHLAHLAGQYDPAHHHTRMAFVSATVYESIAGPVSLVRSTILGSLAGEIRFWSNVDFRHFSGIGVFSAGEPGMVERTYGLFLAAGDGSALTDNSGTPFAWFGISDPGYPVLPRDVPCFVVLKPEELNADALALAEDLHAFYRDHGEALAVAYAARKASQEQRRAHLLDHPPKPQDVNVHFWKRTGANSAHPAD